MTEDKIVADETTAPTTEAPATTETADAGSANAVETPALEDFGPASAVTGAPTDNLGRVMDVCVPITARIGIVRKTISEVLDLVPGSIVDLERNAGQPIDLVVGDKLIARGEIVVVDDRYGVRITQVVQED